MSSGNRNGIRKHRSEFTNRKKPELGYYLIVTDTKCTERFYFEGLKNSIEKTLGQKLIIKVVETETINMTQKAIDFQAELPQYAQAWIVFDKDENSNFDQIIEDAKNCNIKSAWSNPCIEVWFSAYFGNMLNSHNSVSCCKYFKKLFKDKVKQEYRKNDQNLYNKLINNGDESKAIKIAIDKINFHKKNLTILPSKMIPASTVFELVSEIKENIK